MGRVSKRGNSLRKTAGVQTEQNVKVRRYRAVSMQDFQRIMMKERMNRLKFRMRLQGNM